MVADSLSRDFHLTDNELTSHFSSVYPSHVLKQFRIKTLPPQIILDKLAAVQRIRESARTSATNAKLDRWLARWHSFLTRIELDDNEFLDTLNKKMT